MATDVNLASDTKVINSIEDRPREMPTGSPKNSKVNTIPNKMSGSTVLILRQITDDD